MFCIIRSHSLSIWPISLWSDVVKSVGSRIKEQKWCPPREHRVARTILHLPFPAGQKCCSPAALSRLSSLGLIFGTELQQWWLLPPMAVRTGSPELQLSIAHSFQQKLSHLSNDSVPSAGGNVAGRWALSITPGMHTGRFFKFLIHQVHQTWDPFQLLPVWEDKKRKFLTKSSCAVPFFFPFPLDLMSKQPEA